MSSDWFARQKINPYQFFHAYKKLIKFFSVSKWNITKPVLKPFIRWTLEFRIETYVHFQKISKSFKETVCFKMTRIINILRGFIFLVQSRQIFSHLTSRGIKSKNHREAYNVARYNNGLS